MGRVQDESAVAESPASKKKRARHEGSMMHHLANAHSVTGPAGIIYRTALDGPLDRVLTLKKLIYLLNLQFYCVSTSYPMDNC